MIVEVSGEIYRLQVSSWTRPNAGPDVNFIYSETVEGKKDFHSFEKISQI